MTVPWFAIRPPWPWFNAGSRKSLSGSGTPQMALTPGSARLGFDPAISSASLRGSAAAPTVNAIFNMSAAEIASAPAFGTGRNVKQQ